MLKVLLDEHISPTVAEGLRRHDRSFSISSVHQWESGRFMGLSDDLLLLEAANQQFTFVTYDRRTIPPLIKAWMEAGRDHGGLIIVDEKTIPPADIGGLIRALGEVFKLSGESDWTNQVIFLRRLDRP